MGRMGENKVFMNWGKQTSDQTFMRLFWDLTENIKQTGFIKPVSLKNSL